MLKFTGFHCHCESFGQCYSERSEESAVFFGVDFIPGVDSSVASLPQNDINEGLSQNGMRYIYSLKYLPWV
jgi:hypothetical protein